MQGRGIGHQPHEFVAMISERMDLEDQRLEAVQHREFLRWQAEQSASTSGDTTAPSSLKLFEEGAAIRLGRTSTWTVSGRGSMAVEEARPVGCPGCGAGRSGVLTRVARAAAQAFGEAGGQTEYRMGDDPTGFGFVIR